MNDYIKLIISGSDDEILKDILVAELADLGVEAFDEDGQNWNAYIKTADFDVKIFDEIFKKAPFAGEFQYSVENVKQENWNELWESGFEPVIIDNKCIVHASFHNGLPEAGYKILINPKMTFGTGHHETTYLCITEILDLDLNGKTVLDMGCGTGVLGILAAMKGAASVTAIDNDSSAVENAIENAELNAVTQKMEIFEGTANSLKNRKLDVIIANINRNVLLNDMEQYAECLVPDGTLIISGFYKEDVPLLLDTAKAQGLEKTGENSRNGWTVLKLRKICKNNLL